MKMFDFMQHLGNSHAFLFEAFGDFLEFEDRLSERGMKSD